MMMSFSMMMEERNKETRESYDMPIPQYSMRGSIMRRKWKKANTNVSILSSSSILPSASATKLFFCFNKMITIILLISSLNICSCVGSAIQRGVLPGEGVTSLNFQSQSSYSSFAKRDADANGRGGSNSNNATLTSAIDNSAESHMTWIIERKECAQLDDNCICESKSRNTTIIRCHCDEDSQVAHLQSPGRGQNIKHASLFVQKVHWTWRFEHCSKVVLHPDFLATVEGSPFHVEFFNISQFHIHESAFATRANHGGQNQVSVVFNQCNMDSLPTKTFPSYLNSIKFTRCTIKSLARRFIHSIKMDKVTIDGTKIDNIDSEAFYSQSIIDTLTVVNSTILSVSRYGIASAMNKMIWMNTVIQVLQEDALSGSVAEVILRDSEFVKVENNGFVIKTWSKVELSNNTFGFVARKGIDLSHYSGDDPNVEIIDNSWGTVERDFIATGLSETPFIEVRNNTFLQQCDCGNTFTSHFTTNGSRLWFHQQILNNSRCPVSEQVLTCLLLNEHINSTDSGMLPYDSLDLLCDSKVYMCINDVSEIATTSEETIPGRPQLPNRLRVLAYFIAAMGIFIIASLLITMCVFLCRKKIPRKKSSADSSNPLQNLESAQGKKTGMPKSLSGGEYADIVFKHHNNTTASSRPRSVLLEDVEMEDKGVQTMPTELSSEVLEGLREKLSRPDSFWDAKETIDHLYDLIQVKELSSGLSSPPDVTMCNGGQSTTASTARLLPSTSSSPVAQITSAGVSVSVGGSEPLLAKENSPPPTQSKDSSPVSDTPPPLPATSPPSGVPLQRYAQIRNKGKTAPICEYADPSDTSMHIYSELTPQLHSPDGKDRKGAKLTKSPSKHPSPDHSTTPTSSTSSSPLKNAFLGATKRLFSNNGPILCEYTDPKDVQTHVYAELSNNSCNSLTPHQLSNNLSPARGSLNAEQSCSPNKQPISHSPLNTITIEVPPPPHISIPHSSSFHNSPRLLNRILKETELSSSNPSLATNVTTPVKIIHRSDGTTSKSHPRLPHTEKLKRSASHVDASPKKISSAAAAAANNISMLNVGRTGTQGSDTQKRPLPSIPSWSDRNEGKSQF